MNKIKLLATSVLLMALSMPGWADGPTRPATQAEKDYSLSTMTALSRALPKPLPGFEARDAAKIAAFERVTPGSEAEPLRVDYSVTWVNPTQAAKERSQEGEAINRAASRIKNPSMQEQQKEIMARFNKLTPELQKALEKKDQAEVARVQKEMEKLGQELEKLGKAQEAVVKSETQALTNLSSLTIRMSANDFYESQPARLVKELKPFAGNAAGAGGNYYPYAKGGPYNKWYGNIWLTIDFRPHIKSIISEVGNLTSEEYYGKDGVSYTASGAKGPSYRRLPENCVFDVGGSSIFPKKYANVSSYLAYLNSKLALNTISCLNPTVNTQIFDVKRLPFIRPERNYEMVLSALSDRCVAIKRLLCKYSIIEMNFTISPLLVDPKISDLREKLREFFSYENHLLAQVLINEAIIDKIIFDIYELSTEDKAMVLAKEGESIGGLPVLAEARADYLAETNATAEFPLDNIRNFIEALPTAPLAELGINDLGEKFESLYQGNNDLEEFCIKNHTNPINAWYFFKKSRILPTQRTKTIALELLADLIRRILNEDEDGIVPLVRNAGEEILIDRIERMFEEKGLSSAQFSTFPTILGREGNDHINNNFFADLSNHLNLYKQLPMTPFIWHIASGPRQGFDAYIIIYKWNRDKLFTLKSVHIEKRETALRNRQSDLLNVKSAEAENEKDQIFHQLKEIDSLKKKIDELLAEGYDPKLDDGVGKNIAPLQKKGIIAYEVLNAGQLKKYLNADW